MPAYGGTDQRNVQYMVFPRGFYGSPSFVSSIALLSGLPGGCFSNNLVGNLTDAQITASGMRCPVVASAPPLIGVDRLNNVVAPGRAPIPANTVISADNVQNLTGLTPQQYADQASAAIGQPQGYFVFGPTGYLTNVIIPAQLRPTAVADSFDTPHTLGYNVGVQRELTTDMSIEADYFHRDIRNLLGVRNSNIAFESRVLGRRFLPPFTTGPIITFGPFYEGQYDALIINFNKRYSQPLPGRRQLHLRAGDRQFARASIRIHRTRSSARCRWSPRRRRAARTPTANSRAPTARSSRRPGRS